MRRPHVGMLVVAVFVLLAFTGCGGPDNVAYASTTHISGFWNGLWDGFTAIIAFFLHLLSLGHYNVYEVHNNGDWYNFGFLLGVGAFSSGGVSVVRSR